MVTLHNAITGSLIGKQWTNETRAISQALSLSQTSRYSIDIKVDGIAAGFAANGSLYLAKDIEQKTEALWRKFNALTKGA